MQFSAPNRAENTTLAEASDLLAKLNKLGLYFGQIHLNEQTAGGSQANIVPLWEAMQAGIEPMGKYNYQVFANGNFHNVAGLARMFEPAGADGFRRVYNSIFVGADATAALLNIPGAFSAIDALIKKA